jgi:hypothetical protein
MRWSSLLTMNTWHLYFLASNIANTAQSNVFPFPIPKLLKLNYEPLERVWLMHKYWIICSPKNNDVSNALTSSMASSNVFLFILMKLRTIGFLEFL